MQVQAVDVLVWFGSASCTLTMGPKKSLPQVATASSVWVPERDIRTDQDLIHLKLGHLS